MTRFDELILERQEPETKSLASFSDALQKFVVRRTTRDAADVWFSQNFEAAVAARSKYELSWQDLWKLAKASGFPKHLSDQTFRLKWLRCEDQHGRDDP
jgi:hypothetical protein